MPKLKQLQQHFCHAVIKNNPALLPFIAEDYVKERLDIYRQNILANLTKTLSIIYPGFWQLVGDECASSCALAFVKNKLHLPKPGELDSFASEFPYFLTTLAELQEYPYLQDYTHLEWYQHLAYEDDNCKALGIDVLDLIPPENLATLKIEFLPSVHFFESIYPIPKIERLTKEVDAPIVNLVDGESYCLVARIEDEVKTFWLEKEIWSFLKALSQGQTLESSASLLHDSKDYDLTQALMFIFNQHLVYRVVY